MQFLSDTDTILLAHFVTIASKVFFPTEITIIPAVETITPKNANSDGMTPSKKILARRIITTWNLIMEGTTPVTPFWIAAYIKF